MLAWLSKGSGPLFALVAVAIVGAVAQNIVDDLWRSEVNVEPSALANGVVSICLFLYLLFLPATRGRPNAKWEMNAFVIFIALAYLMMAILYSERVMAGYGFTLGADEILFDVAGTMCFALAWFCVVRLDDEDNNYYADLVAIFVMSLLTLLAGAVKGAIEAKFGSPLWEAGSASALASADLLLGICNAAVLLGLYGSLRRAYFAPAPSPIFHIPIIFYGCAQIAVQAQDCLAADTVCTVASFQGIVALSVAWLLLAGKIALAIYVAYAFSMRVERKAPLAGAPVAA